MNKTHTYDYTAYEEARHRAELTNEQIAGILGVSVRTYDRWKARWRTDGRVTVRRAYADVLERVLGLSPLHDGQAGPSAVVDARFRFQPDLQAGLADAVEQLLDGQDQLWARVNELLADRDVLRTRLDSLEAAPPRRRSAPKRRST